MSQVGTDDSMSDEVFEDDTLRAPAQRSTPSPTGYRDYQLADTPSRHQVVDDDIPIHKTILLGDSGVGKTSLLVQFETGKFQSGNFSATVGIGFTILCALSFLATGSYQKLVGKNVDSYISQSSASRAIQAVVEALSHPNIIKKYIQFPQNASERQVLKKGFYEKFKIPGVIGCIDGTFVSMIRPTEHEERYYCRKGYHARNVMLITDANLNILHVDVKYGGATHDNFIFDNSVIKGHLERLTDNGESVYLLGDSGFAQRSYLMTPFSNPEHNSPEEYYNNLHSSARNSVERTIGILKGRFRCLLVHRVLHYDPQMVGKIILACCVLHNICNNAGIPAPFLSTNEMMEEQSLIQTLRGTIRATNDQLANGRACRQLLVNQLWRARAR